ncbi:uncharacterized protein MELLADRAFT_46921 [Melampsora larici-populina 98AG31]|uniref:uS12 prolyl 3,4-dihydroxylase n=1 Tax=Melampsora larici-populina (strain 98AG31 / pathotype 3-4-7) TaxID=747676 RepID=F4R926_MELLP|nr:uncharacterized protein MELLADRAFT_46921 [Melampsora larici-populina 98AG31]EGG11230.1 hypothetical protein MELLADRAFT_46921 [Melampsora larici-populina 98AG31]
MAVKFPDNSSTSSEPQPNTKRIKLSQTTDATAFGSSDLLTSVAPRLKQEYEESVPYHHAVLQDIFNDQILRNARKEIKENLCFTPKETDIYKIFQTGDLANLDGLSGEETNQLQHVKLIRDSLYSEEFRNLLQSVTSCGPLSGKQTDMSINDYRQGCHLLNHDDVISTRRVSFILYLTDPDNPWEMNDGGSLELYPVDPKTSQPLHTPSKKILPRWNQFVFFVVQPGQSFHSVEEVYTPKKNRLSISGWFHFPNEGEKGYEESLKTKEEEDKKSESLGASLQQLVNFTFLNEPIVATESAFLTDDEFSFLSKYIDPSYLKASELGKIRNKFVAESTINLIEFLDYGFSCDLKSSILLNEARDLVTLSNSKASDLNPPEFRWVVAGPPHKHRYLKPDPNTLALNPSTQKLNKLKELLESSSFLKWLSIISASEILAHNVAPRRFRPGLDYTLATANSSPILELHLSLTPSHGWEDEELGGWECYMASTEEDESDPAIYNAPKMEGSDDGDTNLLTIYPTWNSFHLVLRDSDILTFTKYVSYKSPQSKWDIKATYQVQDDDEEENED